jgi:hypothetical protein
MILNEITDAWNNIPLKSFFYTTDPAIVDISTYQEPLSGFIRCEEPYYRERGL